MTWIDEEIANTGHYAEWQARFSDTKGRIMWTIIPRLVLGGAEDE